MSTQWTRIAALAMILTISGPVLVGAQSSQTKSDTYTWNGEFVSLDTTAMTMTVKSRVAYQEAISELKHFKAGDRVSIVWSGVQDSSDAVRQVRRPEATRGTASATNRWAAPGTWDSTACKRYRAAIDAVRTGR